MHIKITSWDNYCFREKLFTWVPYCILLIEATFIMYINNRQPQSIDSFKKIRAQHWPTFIIWPRYSVPIFYFRLVMIDFIVMMWECRKILFSRLKV